MAEDDASRGSWSPGFQRLRAESVVLSLIVFGTTFFDINLHRIPLIAMEIATPIPRAVVLLFLWLFFFYFYTNWWVRFFVERRDVLFPSALVERFTDAMQAQTLSFDNITPVDTRDLEARFAEAVEDSDHLSTRIKNELVHLTGELRTGKLEYDRTMAVDRDVIEGEGTEAELKRILQRIRNENSDISERLIGHQTWLGVHADRLDKFNAGHAELQQKWSDELNSKYKTLQSSVSELKDQRAEILAALRQPAKTIDKGGYGFWAPAAFSGLLFGVSAHQGSRDIWQFIVLFDCEQFRCFLRRETGLLEALLRVPLALIGF